MANTESFNNQLDLQGLNNTVEFFLDFNYFNYYSLDFLRFYAKKTLKLVGFYDGDYKFHQLIDTILSLKDKDGGNAKSLLTVYQLSSELKKAQFDKFDKFDKESLKNIIEDILYSKLYNLSNKQQYELSSSLLEFSESVGIELSAKNEIQKIIDDYNQEYGFFNTLTPGKVCAMLFAAAVALSEGIASVYFMGVYTMQSLFFIGVPSFLVNYLLFYPSLEQLICSDGSEETNSSEKEDKTTLGYYVNLTSGFFSNYILPPASFAAGAITAFVALNSMLETFGAIFFNLSPILALTAPPASLVAFVSFFAFSSFIANTALLLEGFKPSNISYFYQNGENNIFSRLYKNFTEFCSNLIDANFAKAFTSLGKVLIDASMLGAGITLAAFIYMSSLGLFRNQAVKTLTSVFGLSSYLADFISIAAVTYCGQLLNGLFYVDKILYPVNYLGNALFGETLGVIKKPVDAAEEALALLSDSYNSVDEQAENILNNLNNAACANNSVPSAAIGASLGVIAYFSWINGYAQGEGFASDSLSTSGLEWLSLGFLTASTASMCAYCLGTLSSFIANYNQASDYIQNDTSGNKKRKI